MRPPPLPPARAGRPLPHRRPKRVPEGLLARCAQVKRVPARSGARVLAASHLAPADGGVPAGIARAARSPQTWHGVRPRLERCCPRPAPPAHRLRPRRPFPLWFRLTQRRRRPQHGEHRWADARGPGTRWARGAGRGQRRRESPERVRARCRKLRSEPTEGWGREGRGQRGGAGPGGGGRRRRSPHPPERGAPLPPGGGRAPGGAASALRRARERPLPHRGGRPAPQGPRGWS